MLSKIRIYIIHKEKNAFGNVFQIVYFSVRNISCVIGLCFFFFLIIKKADNNTVLNLDATLHWRMGETLLRCHNALTRGREETICTDAWERRVRVYCQVGPEYFTLYGNMLNINSNNTYSESLTKHIVQHEAHMFGCLNSK